MRNSKRINELRAKLMNKSVRVLERYKYYDMKYSVDDFGISTPPKLSDKNIRVGWCGKAVKSLADRLSVAKFESDNFDFTSLFRANNFDVLFDSAILSALISSCSFVYVYKDADDQVRMEVLDGSRATGVIDKKTNLLTEGYAVLDRDEFGQPISEAYFTKEYTQYILNGKEEFVPNPTGVPLLIPIIYDPSDTRPFGHSRISRACMDLVQCASRTLKRAEVSAEFYSFPQKYITGLSNDAEPMDSWQASMSAMMQFTRDEEGNYPTVGQFQQQSMSPYMDQLAMYVKAFCGETGLTSDDLGFVNENPSSSEAIKASHETLRLLARKAQTNFNVCFLNLGYVARMLADGRVYNRSVIFDTQITWKPLFEPDVSALSNIGDAIIKLNQAIPNVLDKESLYKLTGIGDE